MSVRTYHPDDEDAVFAIMQAALEAGELPGSTEHDLEKLRERLGVDPTSRFVALDDDAVVGIMSPMHHLLIVQPAYRRRGHGTRLVEAALERAEQIGETLELGVPLGVAAAEAFATQLGFAYHSSLWLLRLAASVTVPPAIFPTGYTTRFITPGVDDEMFTDLLTRSFVGHPSPIYAPLEVIRHVHSQPEFDPTTILLLYPPDTADPIAFCRDSFHDASGEIDFVGVLPEYRGHGLGRELLRWGIADVRRRGAVDVFLTVEALNELALGLYERTGFVRVQEWPRWTKQDMSSPTSSSARRP